MAVTENDIFRTLERGQLLLPPLAVQLLQRNPSLRALRNLRQPDAILQVSAQRRQWKFLAEIKTTSNPLTFNTAVLEITQIAPAAKLLPMVIMPYLSPENLARLESSRISGLDLCGNGIVIVPDQLLVLRTGQPNRFPRSEPIRNIYRGDSSLAARVFLTRPEFPTVGDIQKTITQLGATLTLSTVSKVLKALEADLIVARQPRSIRLLQPDKLLESLTLNYAAPIVHERFIGRVDLDESQLQQALAHAATKVNAKLALTGAASATHYATMAREPVVAAYCNIPPADLIAALPFRAQATDRFPNLDLRQTPDARVYFDTTPHQGMPIASPLQAYLELMSGDKRQRESADQLRTRLLSHARGEGSST